MKYWPAIVSAALALAVAIPVLHELVPGFQLSERVEQVFRNDAVGKDAVRGDAVGQNAVGQNAVGKDAARKNAAGKDVSNATESTEALGVVALDRMFVSDQSVTAPAGPGRIAHLTLDAKLQRAADAALRSRRIPHGGIVAMDVRTGELLVYAARRGSGMKDDAIVSATLPATDVFKLITAAALVNVSGASASTRVCYRDPGAKLELDDLSENKGLDTWCPSYAEAIARNLDAPIARSAFRSLDKSVLEQTASAFGFGSALVFDQPVQVSRVSIPSTDLGLVEASIGSQHAFMSAMQGLLIGSVVANGGKMVRPVVVRTVEISGGKVVYRAPKGPRVVRQVITSDTANELAKMMIETTEIGEGFRAFHDETGHPRLGNMKAAAITGAERVANDSDQTTWFVGFAPVDEPAIAIAIVAKNRKGANGNAQTLAVDVLRAYVEHSQSPVPTS